MIDDRNFDLFGGPKWPKNRAYQAHIRFTSKRSSSVYVEQDAVFKKSGKKLLIYLGAQNGPVIGPLGPIFYTHLKVVPMSM